jgi:hypothetical protein
LPLLPALPTTGARKPDFRASPFDLSRRTNAGGRIEFDIACLDEPVVGVRRAGRVIDVLQLKHTFLVYLQQIGSTSRAAVAEQKLRADKSNPTVRVRQLGRIGDDFRLRVGISNTAVETQYLVRRVDKCRIRTGETLATAHEDTAGHLCARAFPDLCLDFPGFELDHVLIGRRIETEQEFAAQLTHLGTRTLQALLCHGRRSRQYNDETGGKRKAFEQNCGRLSGNKRH